MEEEKETNQKINNLNSIPNQIIKTVGATTSILTVMLIASLFNLIPKGIGISVGLFISLPFVFSFIFGIITNRPNFTSTIRHYSFILYLFIALVIYFIYMMPDSFMLFGKYFVQFFMGLIIALISGLFYLITYRIFRNYSYRIKASVSFVVSLAITFLIIFILKYYKVFEWIS